jgi:hypothetical protein
MQFTITVVYVRRQYRMQVEQVYKGPVLEQFRVSAGGKSVLLQSNRPLFIARGLRHRRPQWKVLEGRIHYQSALQLVIEAIEKKIGNQL